ncbi:MAG: hypothetical protein AAB360_03970 [Patescibacteria group bacterium]
MWWLLVVRALSIANIIIALIIAAFVNFSVRERMFSFLSSLILLDMALWAGFQVANQISPSFLTAIITFSYGLAFAPLALLYVRMFSGQKIGWWRPLVLFAPWSVISFLSLREGAFFEGIRFESGNMITWGTQPLLLVYETFLFVCVAWLSFEVKRARDVITDPKRRRRFGCLVWGLALSFGSTLIMNMILPMLGIFRFNIYGPLAILPMSLAIIYLITRYHPFWADKEIIPTNNKP